MLPAEQTVGSPPPRPWSLCTVQAHLHSLVYSILQDFHRLVVDAVENCGVHSSFTAVPRSDPSALRPIASQARVPFLCSGLPPSPTVVARLVMHCQTRAREVKTTYLRFTVCRFLLDVHPSFGLTAQHVHNCTIGLTK